MGATWRLRQSAVSQSVESEMRGESCDLESRGEERTIRLLQLLLVTCRVPPTPAISLKPLVCRESMSRESVV